MRSVILALAAAVLLAGCSGSVPSSTFPTPPTDTTGIWFGDSTDSAGEAQMRLVLSQYGAALVGTMTVMDITRNVPGRGTVGGSFNGGTVTLHIVVPQGDYTGAMLPCSMTLDGQGQISPDGHTITMTYSGQLSGTMIDSNPCGGAMNDGRLTLTR